VSENAQTTPLARTLTTFVQNEIARQLQLRGQSLPVSVVGIDGAFVTVKFEVQSPDFTFPNIKVPQAISRYARPPANIGDTGFVVSADVYLGGVTGLGGGYANFDRLDSNLSTLVYFPLSNISWPSVNQNAYTITAPGGAVIQDDSGNSKITLTSSSITLQVGSNSIVIDASGVKIMGKDFLTHRHTGVNPGGGQSGGVVP
jgi:hypothetical protein